MPHNERLEHFETAPRTDSESGSPLETWGPISGVPAVDGPASSDLNFGRLTFEEGVKLAREAGVTDEGIRRLIACRRAPSRNVKGGHGNIRGEYFSPKNGHPVQYESFTCEWVVAQSLESNPKVVWYGCQPQRVKVKYFGADGKRQRPRARVDYIYLDDDGRVHEIECKLASEAEKKLASKPHLYARDEHGVVYRLPVREALLEMGIQHRVVIPEEIDLLLARNAMYLQPYRRQALSGEIAKQIQETLRDGPLKAVVLATRTTGNIDDVLKAVAQDCVYIDFQHFPAWETETTLVHRSRASMSAFVHLAGRPPVFCDVVPPLREGGNGNWDGKPFTITHVGDTKVFLRSGNAAGDRLVDMEIAVFERLVRQGVIVLETVRAGSDMTDRQVGRYSQLTDKERAAATERAEVVRGVLSGRWNVEEAAKRLGKTRRQVYRYIRSYQGNDSNDPDGGFVALAPKTRNCGLRGWNVDSEVLQRLDKTIDELFFRKKTKTLPRPTRAAVFRAYRERERGRGDAVSRKTFYKRVDARTNQRNVAARDGERVASKKRVSRGRDLDAAVYPFHHLQVDGTPADALLDLFDRAAGGCWFERPIITPVHDVYSETVVGFSCLFGAESSVSVMMASRDVVRRHGRFADVLFADNAGAHKSDPVRDLVVGLCKGDLRFRPSGRPEFGGQVERLIKSFTQELLSELAGYTERLKAVRTLTKSHDPLRDAVWSLEALTRFLEFFFFEFYNRRVHPNICAIPEQRLQEGFRLRGSRNSQRVRFNDNFVLATMPTVKLGRILDREKGVFPA